VPQYVLLYRYRDQAVVASLIGGLATYGRPPWETREIGDWFELRSDDAELMRQIWKWTRRYVRGSAVEPDPKPRSEAAARDQPASPDGNRSGPPRLYSD
jgi:hypothetical protein